MGLLRRYSYIRWSTEAMQQWNLINIAEQDEVTCEVRVKTFAVI